MGLIFFEDLELVNQYISVGVAKTDVRFSNSNLDTFWICLFCTIKKTTDDATSGPIVPGTVLGLLGIQALTRTATIELSYDT